MSQNDCRCGIEVIYHQLMKKSHFIMPWDFLQIPDEEKDLGPQDRLIHVYHFTRDASQNHMVTVSSSLFFS